MPPRLWRLQRERAADRQRFGAPSTRQTGAPLSPGCIIGCEDRARTPGRPGAEQSATKRGTTGMNPALLDPTCQSGISADAEYSVQAPTDHRRHARSLIRGGHMSEAFAPIAALLFSAALLLTGNGLLVVLLPVRADAESFATLDAGVLGAACFRGFAIGCLTGPRVIRRVGHIRTLTAMSKRQAYCCRCPRRAPLAARW